MRLLLSSAGALAGGAFWVRQMEPYWFDLTHTRIQIPGSPSLRILHIADIHMSDGMEASDLEKGLILGLQQRPDAICLTGDFVSTTSGFDASGLRRMLQRAAGAAPTFAVLGNHDGGAWLARFGGDSSVNKLSDLVQSTGVKLLRNRSVRLGRLRLVGLADLWAGGFDPGAAFLDAAPSEPTIVLCHNPDGKDRLLEAHWDLMLSGHTHGGQARVPGMQPVWAPVQDKRFVSGLYSWNERQLFITRGLGSPKHVRALCRPEVSFLEIASHPH